MEMKSWAFFFSLFLFVCITTTAQHNNVQAYYSIQWQHKSIEIMCLFRVCGSYHMPPLEARVGPYFYTVNASKWSFCLLVATNNVSPLTLSLLVGPTSLFFFSKIIFCYKQKNKKPLLCFALWGTVDPLLHISFTCDSLHISVYMCPETVTMCTCICGA